MAFIFVKNALVHDQLLFEMCILGKMSLDIGVDDFQPRIEEIQHRVEELEKKRNVIGEDESDLEGRIQVIDNSVIAKSWLFLASY